MADNHLATLLRNLVAVHVLCKEFHQRYVFHSWAARIAPALPLHENCIKADIAMGGATSGSIPCPECTHGGSITYGYIPATDKMIGARSAPKCVRFY